MEHHCGKNVRTTWLDSALSLDTFSAIKVQSTTLNPSKAFPNSSFILSIATRNAAKRQRTIRAIRGSKPTSTFVIQPSTFSDMLAEKPVPILCPPEVLLELHMSAEEFAKLVKEKTALALFREGRLSSGLASRWLGQPRALFLMNAMAQGACLLDQGQTDYERESAL